MMEYNVESSVVDWWAEPLHEEMLDSRKVCSNIQVNNWLKGQSKMKVCISYKREGDGFQYDALCDDGYTFFFLFWHGNAPKLRTAYDHLDLLDIAKCVVWVSKWPPNIWMRMYMDNLYKSQKLFSALFIAKC